MIQLAAVPVTDAVRMMSETPARIIGERTKGKIAVDYDADIVVFNDNVDVQMTIVQGEIVFSI
ncbi:MAG: amidohydrolase family protein [Ruthenibacterium sp.]